MPLATPHHPNAYGAYGMPDHNNKTVTAATGSLASNHVVGPWTGVWILRSGSGGAIVIMYLVRRAAVSLTDARNTYCLRIDDDVHYIE